MIIIVIIKKIFDVDNINAKFIDIYYRKQHIVAGLRYLFYGDIINQKYFYDEDKILYSNVVKVERKIVLLSLLSKLNFSLENIKNNAKLIFNNNEPKQIKNLDLTKIIKNDLVNIITGLMNGSAPKYELESTHPREEKFFNKYNCQLFGLSKKFFNTKKN